MENNPVKVIELKNNLKLKIYDSSKKMAGDKWLVSVSARIEIPVDENFKLPRPDFSKEEIKKLLGNEVVFEQKRERFFIDGKNRKSVFDELCGSFLKSSLNYISLPEFPEKFLIMKLEEKKGKAFLEKTAKKFRPE